MRGRGMRGPITPFDHAFADGGVFASVNSIEQARAAIGDFGRQTDTAAEQLLAVWQAFRAGGIVGDGVRLGMNARLVNLGEREHVRIEGPAALRGILRVEPDGRLDIAPFVYAGDGVLVSAQMHVSIGAATLLAHGVQLFDNNSHPVNSIEREVQFRRMLGDKSVVAPMTIEAAPVSIGRRCWLGMGTIVMRGVTIGDDTIVAAGSVVTRSLPAGVVAAGNPAGVVRELSADERTSRDGWTVDSE